LGVVVVVVLVGVVAAVACTTHGMLDPAPETTHDEHETTRPAAVLFEQKRKIEELLQVVVPSR
jgi:hypothetical protein